jgi:hypothetical protein
MLAAPNLLQNNKLSGKCGKCGKPPIIPMNNNDNSFPTWLLEQFPQANSVGNVGSIPATVGNDLSCKCNDLNGFSHTSHTSHGESNTTQNIEVTGLLEPEVVLPPAKSAPDLVAIPDPEREGIMRFSGGLPASWATVFSALHPDRPPEGLTREQWRERLDAILIFGDRYAHDLERLGWDAERLFAVGEHWQMLDERGIGWFVAEALAEGGRVSDMTWRWVRYETKRGAGRTIWNECQRA